MGAERVAEASGYSLEVRVDGGAVAAGSVVEG